MQNKFVDFARNILDLANMTYTVSNGGKEIQFKSKVDGNIVKLYPTTSTFIHNGITFKSWGGSETDIMENMRYCFDYHTIVKRKSQPDNKEDLSSADDEVPDDIKFPGRDECPFDL